MTGNVRLLKEPKLRAKPLTSAFTAPSRFTAPSNDNDNCFFCGGISYYYLSGTNVHACVECLWELAGEITRLPDSQEALYPSFVEDIAKRCGVDAGRAKG
ncbi:MAG TPA: hypothetical protein VM328_10970 [Fimbriimonadaceae bacterium]|nr:hypothetical protein [Fimbriimonadaceae bacterium]